MKQDLIVQDDIVVPSHELEITTSRSGGPGGQHVNKTDTRITVRWNVNKTTALNDEQKARVMHKLASQLTNEGDLIIHNSASRSQEQNRKSALARLAQEIRNALYVPKERIATKVPKKIKATRVQSKIRRGVIKKMRRTKMDEE